MADFTDLNDSQDLTKKDKEKSKNLRNSNDIVEMCQVRTRWDKILSTRIAKYEIRGVRWLCNNFGIVFLTSGNP